MDKPCSKIENELQYKVICISQYQLLLFLYITLYIYYNFIYIIIPIKTQNKQIIIIYKSNC